MKKISSIIIRVLFFNMLKVSKLVICRIVMIRIKDFDYGIVFNL